MMFKRVVAAPASQSYDPVDDSPDVIKHHLKPSSFYGNALPRPTLLLADKSKAESVVKERPCKPDLPTKALVEWGKGMSFREGGMIPTLKGTPPSKPVTAYKAFLQHKREEIMKAHPDYKQLEGKDQLFLIREDVGRQWRVLPDAEKQKYEDLAEADHARFWQEVEAFDRLNPGYKGLLQRQLLAERHRTWIGKAPAKPLTAFGVYLKSKYQAALADAARVQQESEKKVRKEVRAEARRVWRALDDEDKRYYVDLADEDKQRWDDEVVKFEEKNPDYRAWLEAQRSGRQCRPGGRPHSRQPRKAARSAAPKHKAAKPVKQPRAKKAKLAETAAAAVEEQEAESGESEEDGEELAAKEEGASSASEESCSRSDSEREAESDAEAQEEQQQDLPPTKRSVQSPAAAPATVASLRTPQRTPAQGRGALASNNAAMAALVGRLVVKEFMREDGSGQWAPFAGTVVEFNPRTQLFFVRYEDDDEEDMGWNELQLIIQPLSTAASPAAPAVAAASGKRSQPSAIPPSTSPAGNEYGGAFLFDKSPRVMKNPAQANVKRVHDRKGKAPVRALR